MQRITFTILLTLLYAVCLSQNIAADKILGTWSNEENNTRIEIFKKGAQYFGKLVWSIDLYEPDGKTARRDSNNHDLKLQERSQENMEILMSFTYEDGIWDDGKMYDRKSGKTYSCFMRTKEDVLEIRSYVGIPLFGRSTYWQRQL
ncbi:DUF2147 domain-containing protein [Dyadobacter bucti]|jgi:uncharacterized protein (DUF2147 family)|uniref:DUF2147 domain-containing protein n=1 Tax=Dyadobacter bucti TaxID=2572203 RepID=UPI0011096762|nr:DUF2147 domain-containing protein [Dyadobacter bucti]